MTYWRLLNPKQYVLWFLNMKFSIIVMMASMTLMSYLTLFLWGEGVEKAPLFMMQTINSVNWDIYGFLHDYRMLSVTLNEKYQIPKNCQIFWQIFWQFFYKNWIFWMSIFLHFCIYHCSLARYQSLQYLIFCVWMSVFHWIQLFIYRVNNESVVPWRTSPIFSWHTL